MKRDMIVTIIGYQPVSFTNNRQELIEGVNLFIAFDDPNCTGKKADKVFVRPDIPLPKDFKLSENLRVNLVFNYKGKLEAITKVE